MSAHDPLCPSETHGLLCACALIRMVRANERGAIGMRQVAAELRVLTNLRAQVEALPERGARADNGVDTVGRDDVLNLIDAGTVMADHDEFCHAKPTTDPRRCAECKQLAAARADERATFQTVIDSYDRVVAATAKYESTLRSAVEALPGERVNGLWYVEIEDVLGLIGGDTQ